MTFCMLWDVMGCSVCGFVFHEDLFTSLDEDGEIADVAHTRLEFQRLFLVRIEDVHVLVESRNLGDA